MNQTDLFNYSTAPHNHTEPSIDAAESIVDQLNGMCRDVLHAVKSSPFGLTCDEVEKILDMKHQTASAQRPVRASEGQGGASWLLISYPQIQPLQSTHCAWLPSVIQASDSP